MPSATVDDVLQELGELPDRVLALIEALGPDRDELIEARARIAGDERLERHKPSERVATLVRLLTAVEPEDEEA